ncbi:MAG: amidohydrolase family protein [Actinomycetaceae bacterium]|nr:amidohydrolase family protein [Actinomycetaceae bacterium]
MSTIQLRGEVLWRDAPGGQATWVKGDFHIRDGRIFKGTPEGGADRTLEGWAIPGLCDVHAHIGLEMSGETSTEVAYRQAVANRDAGTLLIRDCGTPGDTRWVQEDASLPVLLRAGKHVARPKRYIRGYAVEVEDVSDLPEVLVAQAHESNGWVKIVADWIDRSNGADSDLEPLWPTEVLVDAIAAVHEVGARVVAHTFAHKTVDGLLEAGIDCIEHGTGMDKDQIAEAARRGIPVTPTMMQVGLFEEFAAQGAHKYPVYASTMQAMFTRRVQQVRAFIDAGVQLLPGTDSGGYQEHGSLPRELALWQEEAGLQAEEILDLATWRCRDFLGVSSLEEEAQADLVVYDLDPRKNIEVLAGAKTIILRGDVHPHAD